MLLFKADFNKAFNSVNWIYLDSIMEQMGFGDKWRYYIRNCLESGQASVIINGSPANEFTMEKGVRQGDPLSPFLFIIVMERLNITMKTAGDKGVFDGLKVPNSNICLSHLFYADDALFIGEWSRQHSEDIEMFLCCV